MADNLIIHGAQYTSNIPEESLGKLIYSSLLKNYNFPTAFTDAATGDKVSYKTILEKSCRLAESLRKIGIKENDVVALFSENSIEYFYPIAAALYLGCAVTTFNPQYTVGEILHATSISKPSVIFCSEMTVDMLLEISPRIPSLRKVIVLDTEDKQDGFETLEDFITNNSNDTAVNTFKPVDVDMKNQVAFVLYSSGTTGLPKGVMLTHKNMHATFDSSRNPEYKQKFEPGKTVAIGYLPFFHTYGLNVVLLCLLEARPVIILKSFDPTIFLETIQNHRISTLFIVPPIANFLAKTPLLDNYDLSSVEMINCGAAPLSKRIQESLMNRLKNAKVFRQGYGLTETTLGVLAFRIGENRYGSCGKVVPNASAKIIDTETGSLLGPHQRGELCFKGDIIMKGYAGNINATRQIIDKDGWLHTGDVGYYDEDGYFFIVDRVKELIKYKGFQVPPAELEAILLTHPKIADVGVVGLPDESAGELPVAFVVTEPDQTLTEKDVQDFVAKQVSPQKRLRGGVKFVTEIPKNPSGKILRRVLKELLMKPKSKL